MNNTAQKEAMDRAGELPLERRVAERRSNDKDATIAAHQQSLAEYRGKVSELQTTIAALNQQLAVAYERAAQACEGERVADTGDDGDTAYNMAIRHAAAAIRALASHPAAPVQPQVPLIGVLLDAFSELETLWGLNEPGALVRHSDVFRMLVKAGKEQKAAQAAPPVQQTGDVRAITNGTIDGGDARFNQVFVRMDEQPSTELWTVNKRCYLATTRPSAALTDEQRQGLEALADRVDESGAGLLYVGRQVAEAIRAILAASGGAHAVPDGWQPIGSAPMCGMHVLLSNGADVSEGWWEHQEPYIREHRDMDGNYIDQDESDGFDGWLDCNGGMLPEPTHWMSLPAAPTQDQGEGNA